MMLLPASERRKRDEKIFPGGHRIHRRGRVRHRASADGGSGACACHNHSRELRRKFRTRGPSVLLSERTSFTSRMHQEWAWLFQFYRREKIRGYLRRRMVWYFLLRSSRNEHFWLFQLLPRPLPRKLVPDGHHLWGPTCSKSLCPRRNELRELR
jgi:hypothetical protein